MQIDIAQLKQMLLNQIVKVLSAKQRAGDITPEAVDDAMLKLKLVQISDPSELSGHRSLSLSSMSSMNLFDTDGQFDFNKARKLKLIVSSQVKQLLSLKPYGNISDLQTLAVDVLVQILHQQLINQLNFKISQLPNTKLSVEYIELQKSLDLVISDFLPELQSSIAVVLEFETDDADCLVLSDYSQVLLQGGVSGAGDSNSKLKVALPLKGEKNLSMQQLKNIILNADKDLNIINLENLSSATNYFMPDQNGRVKLAPSFSPLTANSQLIDSEGKLHTYQVSFSNGVNLKVIHLPIDDKQTRTLNEAEAAYLKLEHNKHHHNTLIHGGHGSSLLLQVAYCHAPEIVESSSHLTLMLGVDYSNLQEDFIDSSIEGVTLHNHSRLWREVILNEIKNTRKNIFIKEEPVLKQRLELLSNLLHRVINYDLPDIEDLNIDSVLTLNDLAKYLLSQRVVNVDENINNEWSWLIKIFMCQGDPSELINLSDFKKEIKSSLETVNILLIAEAVLVSVQTLELIPLNEKKISRIFPGFY